MPDQTQVTENSTQSRAKVRTLLLRPALDAAMVFAALCMVSLVFGPAPSSAGPNIASPTGASPTGFAMTMSPAVVEAIGVSEPRPIFEIATTASPTSPEAVFRRTSAQTAWALLMISLSVIIALNMALYRHMRQAYTPVRRRKTLG